MAARRRTRRTGRKFVGLFASCQVFLVLMLLGRELGVSGAVLFGRHQKQSDDGGEKTVTENQSTEASLPASGAMQDGVPSYDPERQPLSRIAFGSCSHQSRPTVVWDHILKFGPQLFIWLGDNVYGDRKQPACVAGRKRNIGPWKVQPRFLPAPMDMLQDMYNIQKNNPKYKRLRKQAMVIGTWDDHDYGLNDAGREFVWKEESQQIMLDFLDEPANSPRRKQKGVYAAYDYGPLGKRVKVILTDTRYHKESPSPYSDLLGEEQWEWLEHQLRESTANIHIIGSSVQVIPNLTAVLQPLAQVEGWARFPAARSRLFRILRESNLPGIFFISGDVHFADMNRYDCALRYPLYEFTSSGLTQSVEEMVPPPLQPLLRLIGHLVPGPPRIRRAYGKPNFGTIEINWDDTPIGIDIKVKKDTGETVMVHHILLSDLQAPARMTSLKGHHPHAGIKKDCVEEADLSWFARHCFLFAVITTVTGLVVLALGTCFAIIAGLCTLLQRTRRRLIKVD